MIAIGSLAGKIKLCVILIAIVAFFLFVRLISVQILTNLFLVADGLNKIEIAKKLSSKFDIIAHTVGNSNFPGCAVWQTSVYFGGRNCLSVEAFVKVDYWNGKIEKVVGYQSGTLVEFNSIKNGGAGSISSYKLTESELVRLANSDFDFNKIGVNINSDYLDGFDEFADRETRRQRRWQCGMIKK